MSELPQIRSARFRSRHERDWLRLESLIKQTETIRDGSLSFEDTQELARLYRKAATSLSVAREISLDRNLLVYLETLVSRAFLVVYSPQESLSGMMSRFFSQSAPEAFRNSLNALGLASLAIGMGFLISWALYQADNGWFYTFVPSGLAAGRDPGASTEYLRSVLFDGGGGLLAQLGAFSAYLFSHNTRVALFAFSLGVFACVPSFLLTFYNGLMLGAFWALYEDRSLGYELFGWLSIHGVTEILAIIIATAGGFRMGMAVLFPGSLRRRAALLRASPDAVNLALISVLMLLMAGLLEGFGRQLIQDTPVRIVIGWTLGGAWLSWLFFIGPGRRS